MSFAKLAVSLALLVPLVSALDVQTPTGWTSAEPVTIDWSAVNGDPQTFSIELANEAFNDQFGLANNVPTGAMTLNLTLPQVPPRDGYTIQFIDISNTTDILAESAPFSIGPEVSSSTSSTSTGSAASSGLSSASASITSAAGTTRSVATSAGATTGTGTGTDSAATGGSTSFDNGAVAIGISNTNLASFVAMAVAAIAGARFIGF